MERLTSTLPDDRNWVFLDLFDKPVTAGASPVGAHLPMSEIARIFALIAYLNRQLDGCAAIGRTPTGRP